MRILFLASRFPYPLTQGDRLRAYHFLQLLSKCHQIVLVAPIQTREEYHGLPLLQSFCKQVEVVPVSRVSRALNLVKAPFLPLPWQVTYYLDRRIQQKVEQLLTQTTFDVIHVQLARMAPFVQQWSKTPKVLDFIDALSLNMARRAQQEQKLVSWLFASEAKRMQQYERELTSEFHQLMVCSAIDRHTIGSFPNLHIVPNGVDLENFPFVAAARQPNTIIFTGNMRYFPNVNAAQYFINEVLPLIRAVIPQVQFTIVGPNLPIDLQKQFLKAGVTLAGFVSNVHDYLQRAAVAIAPMRAGSGIQNKVLEAMATGTPVVATPFGVGSLPAESGKHLLIANDAAEFSQAVIRLLSDRTLNQEIAINARQLVEHHFTWGQSVEILATVYQEAIQQYSA